MSEETAKRERYKQYLICKNRGHTASGMTLTSNPPYAVCKHCGTAYRYTEPELIEIQVPENPDE